MDDFVECPKCGFTQPQGDECIACGIIFAKYWAAHGVAQPSPEPPASRPEPEVSSLAPPAEAFEGDALHVESSSEEAGHQGAGIEPYQLEQEPMEAASPVAPLPEPQPLEAGAAPETALPQAGGAEGATHQPKGGPSPQRPAGSPPRHRVMRRDTRSLQMIGAPTMFIRTLAAMACLGIAVLMFANGKGLLSVWPYIIMVFYAGAALWGLSSFRQKVTLQQFATEMAVLVLITLVMRFAAPEMFQVESPTQGTPKVVQPYLPKTSLGSFTKRVLVYTEAGRAVLESRDEVPKSQWDTWVKQANFPAVKSKYSVLTTEDRARVWDVWKRVEELGPMLTDVLSRYQQSAGDRVRFSAPENERAAVKRELDAALLKASQLRARLLIYPEPEEGAY